MQSKSFDRAELANGAATNGRGRQADTPQEIPLRGWRDVLKRALHESKSDNVILLSAGVAFFGLLSLVPGLIAIVALYGLVADPSDVGRQVDDLLAAAPSEVRDLVQEQLTSITSRSSGGLGVTFAVALALALWSASSGMKHLITAINVAYDEEETRGFFSLRSRSLALTIGAIGFVIVALFVITVAPAALADTALGTPARVAISIVRWPLLAAGLIVGLGVLYRYAPDRDEPQWSWTAPGTIVATVVWLAASIGFSVYTANFGKYGETYGSLAGVAVMMLWLLISAASVIVGAELNGEAERQTRRDSTVGRDRPLGRRGAYVADTVGPTPD
jgi:membrane protein